MKTLFPRFLSDKSAATVIGGFTAAWASVAVVGDVTVAGDLAQLLAVASGRS